MDPVCVVSGQCACADHLVILYTRWSMTKAKFFDHTLLPRDRTVNHTSTPTFSCEQGIKSNSVSTSPTTCIPMTVKMEEVQISNLHCERFTALVSVGICPARFDHEYCKVEFNSKSLAFRLGSVTARTFDTLYHYLHTMNRHLYQLSKYMPLFRC